MDRFLGTSRGEQVRLYGRLAKVLILSRMTSQPRQLGEEEFPSDLTGHFWATSEYRPELDRWAFKILDYQNNVLLSGFAFSEGQAAAIVNAWDQVIVASDDEEDPSMDWLDQPE